MWGVSEGWIDTIQVPIRVTKVALEHLALVAARQPALHAQDGLIAIKYLCVVRPLVTVAAALCTATC